MAHRRSFRGRDRKVGDTLWFDWVFTSTALGAGSTAALTHSLSAGALALRPFTILRTRGYWHVRSDQISAAETWGATLGMAVVTEQAVAVGVTAVPTPATDMGSDSFFLHQMVLGFFAFTTGAAYIESGKGMEFDSKAMRRVEDGSDIITVIETPSTVGSGIVQFGARMLIKVA